MEIKAELLKPYTEDERATFIVEQNHRKGYEIKETENSIEAWGFTDDEIQEQEQDKINHLTMTALDFINVIKSLGVSNEMLEGFLASNFEVKHQLMFCQNVYCGVAKSFLPIRIGTTEITPEMIEKAFIDKNGGEI